MTGSAKPARCSSAPSSRRSANGATRGETPPSTSLSACGEGFAQFGKTIAADQRRQQQAVRLERAADLDQRAGQVVDELQRQRGHHEIERAVGERQAPPRRRPRAMNRRARPSARRRRLSRPCRFRRARGAPHRSACRDRPRARTCAAPPKAARPDRRRPGRAGRFRAQARGRARRARSKAAVEDGRALRPSDTFRSMNELVSASQDQAPSRPRQIWRRIAGRPARCPRRGAAAALPVLPRAARRRGRTVRVVLVETVADRAALLRAARHPLRLRSRPGPAVDGGDRRSAGL